MLLRLACNLDSLEHCLLRLKFVFAFLHCDFKRAVAVCVLLLSATVLFSMMFGGLAGMVFGIHMMAMRHVGLVSTFLVIASFVVFRSFFMVGRGMSVMLCGLFMVLSALVLGHLRTSSF